VARATIDTTKPARRRSVSGVLPVVGLGMRGSCHGGPLRPARAGGRCGGSAQESEPAIVAGKRGNARGAKGGRERHLPAGTMPCRPVLSITLWVRKTRPTAPRGNVLGIGEVNRSLTPRGAGPAAPASHASPVSDRPPQGVSRPRRSWRAVCGRSARTVRRGEWGKLSVPRSYPIPKVASASSRWARKHHGQRCPCHGGSRGRSSSRG
jgi:hypothetical protein